MVRAPNIKDYVDIKSLLNANTGYDGFGVTVAILDTGVCINHSALKGRFSYVGSVVGDDGFDRAGHGTFVASILGGRSYDTFLGVAEGFAPRANLISVKVFNDEGFGDYRGFVDGAKLAVSKGADILIYAGGGSSRSRLQDDFVNSISEDFDVATVAAAGNNSSRVVDSPSSAARAISVGSVDVKTLKRSHYSNFGSGKPDIAGFGGSGKSFVFAGVCGTLDDLNDDIPGVGFLKGSSFAVPQIGGLLAQLFQKHGRRLSREELEEVFRIGGSEAVKSRYVGWGVPDFVACINANI